MADQDTSLPIRTEADGTDERVHVKIVDGTTPSQRTTVDTDGNVHAELHGNDPATTDRVIRLSELGAVTPDGVYDASDNTKPGNTGLIASSRAATSDDTTQTERLTSIEDSGGTVRALDIALHDEDGEAFSANNPLPVAISEFEGDEVCDYNTSSAVASDATVNHDYTVTAATTFVGSRVWVSGSGKLKAEVRLEDAPAAGTYTSIFVAFNSTANPNIDIPLDKICGKQVAGAIVRIAITNRDNQAQDVYSTLAGIEK